MKCGISLCLTKEWNCLKDYHVKYYYYIKSNCTYKTSIYLYQGLDISYLPERLDKTSFLLCSLSFLHPYLMLLKICNKSEKAYKKWNFFQKLTFVSSRDYKEAKLWSKCAGQRVKLVQFACDLSQMEEWFLCNFRRLAYYQKSKNIMERPSVISWAEAGFSLIVDCTSFEYKFDSQNIRWQSLMDDFLLLINCQATFNILPKSLEDN